MATSLLSTGDPEEVISCPYNKAHQILRKRMQTHLVKCKKNYPNTNLQECLYNSVHKIPEPEMKFHLETCSDRHKIDRFYYKTESTDDYSSKRFPIANIEIETDECWDNVNVPTYDPEKKCESTPVLRQLKVESAAKKRKFRMEERQRFASLGHIESEMNRVEREKARDFALRAGASATTSTRVDVDEKDPYQVTSLLERIRYGGIPIRPIDNRSKCQQDETDTDTSISDVERLPQGDNPKKGCGRGKFIKKGSSNK